MICCPNFMGRFWIFPSRILHLWKPKLGTVMWAKKVNFSYILFFKDLDYTTPLFDANTSNTSKVKSHHHPEIFFVTCFFFHAGTWHMLSFFTRSVFYWFNLTFNLTFFYLFHLFFIFIPLYFAWIISKKKLLELKKNTFF